MPQPPKAFFAGNLPVAGGEVPPPPPPAGNPPAGLEGPPPPPAKAGDQLVPFAGDQPVPFADPWGMPAPPADMPPLGSPQLPSVIQYNFSLQQLIMSYILHYLENNEFLHFCISSH